MCGAEEKTSVHMSCEWEALALLRHAYLASFLDPEDFTNLIIGANWNFRKGKRTPLTL